MLTHHQEANEFFVQTHRPTRLLGALALIAVADVVAVVLSLLAV